MAYEGGYTSALNSQVWRDSTQQAMRQREELLREAIEDRQQEQADREFDRSLDPDVLGTLKELWGQSQPVASGAQPPMPGQPSVPMMPPPTGMRPPDTGAMPGAAMPPPGAGGSAQQLMGAAAQGPPPPPAGWQPSAAAPATLGGQMSAPPQPAPSGSLGQQLAPKAAVPPPLGAGAAPQPGQPGAAAPAAGPAAAGGGGATPAGGKTGELPPQWLSIPNSIKAMDQAGVPKTKQLAVLKKMLPIIQYQNQDAVQRLELGIRIADRMDKVRKEEIANYRREQGLDSPEAKKLLAMGLKPGTPEWQNEMRKYVAKGEHYKGAPGAGGAGGAGAAPGSMTGYNVGYEKMQPRQQAVVDWYATMQLGGDSTWRVGLSRVKGGAELIKAVDERVPERAKELGLSAADVGTNKAKRVAAQSALTANTKDLATLEPYANMLDQNAEILKGLAEKAIATSAALANKPLNWLRSNASDNPDVAEYLAQMEIVKNEATRVISNPRLVGQMTDTARQEIESVINGTMPLNATVRVLERLQNDSQRRVSTMRAQQSSLEGTIKEMFPGGADTQGGKPAAAGPKAAPKAGDVEDGYRFKGGDPKKKENWEKV